MIEVDLIIANAISNSFQGSETQKLNLINVDSSATGNPLNRNRIPTEIVEYYISLADSQIDGILSQMYKTPLRKCARGQWQLDAEISEYNQIIELTEQHSLNPGDEIIIRDDNTGTEELHIIREIIDQNSFTTIDEIQTNFDPDVSRLFQIDFPPPTNQISSRLAASYIYDKYFSAQNDPNVSEFGKEQRTLARGQLNDILNGRTILECQLRIGDRFASTTIDDNYSIRDRGFDTAGRDMSQPK